MLRNYGYEVIDLGKDVQADKIIAAAKEHNASIIVLSALMTTTMMRMKDTIALKQKENLNYIDLFGLVHSHLHQFHTHFRLAQVSSAHEYLDIVTFYSDRSFLARRTASAASLEYPSAPISSAKLCVVTAPPIITFTLRFSFCFNAS